MKKKNKIKQSRKSLSRAKEAMSARGKQRVRLEGQRHDFGDGTMPSNV